MNTDKIWEISLVVLGGVITGGIGLFTGWLINRCQRSDEKAIGIQERKREFLAFMNQFKGEGINTDQVRFGDFYRNKIPNLRYEASQIVDDLLPERRAEFKSAISTACELSNKQINELKAKEGKMAVIDKIIHIAGGNEF